MPRGGQRVGAGRKPKGYRVVVPMVGHRAPVRPELPPVDTGERAGLLKAPEDLPEDVRKVWHHWAEHAIAERTLTTSTAAGFRQFCQQWAYLDSVVAKIAHLGANTTEAAPYLRLFLNLSQRLDGSMARFKLTALGKPAVSDKPKAAANPWAALKA